MQPTYRQRETERPLWTPLHHRLRGQPKQSLHSHRAPPRVLLCSTFSVASFFLLFNFFFILETVKYPKSPAMASPTTGYSCANPLSLSDAVWLISVQHKCQRSQLDFAGQQASRCLLHSRCKYIYSRSHRSIVTPGLPCVLTPPLASGTKSDRSAPNRRCWIAVQWKEFGARISSAEICTLVVLLEACAAPHPHLCGGACDTMSTIIANQVFSLQLAPWLWNRHSETSYPATYQQNPRHER